MAAGVLIDTSFLITLAGKSRPHHEAARKYWKYFIENRIPIFLSTIVVSEFQIKQEIPPEILRCCVVIPFNWDHAVFTAKLDWTRDRPSGVERNSIKDDIKIIAQATKTEAEFVITEDEESFCRYCKFFKESGQVEFKTLVLKEGFDLAFFDPNGQSEVDFDEVDSP